MAFASHQRLCAMACRVLAGLATLFAGQMTLAAAPPLPGAVPIQFNLDKPAYLTLVIEDAAGRRVRNLIAETQFGTGTSTVVWDGYDDDGRLVSPGTYAVRGLQHGGIRLYFEFAYNTAGNPPWFTADRSGAWMADHSLPAAAVFLPAGVSPFGSGKSQVMLAGIVSESGDPMIFVDTTGQKVYGSHFFGWDGAVAAARDLGTSTRPDVFVYHLMGWQSKRFALRGLNRAGQGVEIGAVVARGTVPREPASLGVALAVHDGLAVISVPVDDELVVLDVKSGKEVGRASMPLPKGLCFAPDGTLYVASQSQIQKCRLTRSDGKVEIAPVQAIVTSGLESPYAMTLDAAGNLYVSDKGSSHQVKVFSPAGALLRTIGHAGGLQLGAYDEQRMQSPQGLAIDDQGQLWVSEFDAWPKRVSVWNAADGKFIKGLYGPPMYGGGGTIDPEDKTRLFYAQYGGLTEWQLDWEKGTAKLKNICVRRSLMGTPEDIYRWHHSVGERPVRLNGRTYLVPTYSGFLRHNDNAPIYLLGDDGIAWPVAFVGTLRRWGPDQYKGLEDVIALYPKEPGFSRLTTYNDLVVTWSDLNFDHKVQTEEFKFRSFRETTFTNAQGQPQRMNRKEVCQYFPDLSANLRWMGHIAAPKLDARGVPVFDLSSIAFMLPPRPEFGGQEEGQENYTTRSGLIMRGAFWAVDRQGKTVWRYPVKGRTSPVQKGGDVSEPTRLLGPLTVAGRGDAGEWYAVSGERGDIFLMTTDGLFIQSIGGHMRNWPLLRYPQAKRGMLIDAPGQHVSFEDEHFHPSITQTKEGEVYLCAGKEHSSIFRVEGFDTIGRIKLPALQVTPALLAGLPATRPVVAAAKLSDKLPVMMSSAPMTLDGRFEDWGDKTAWAPVDPRATAALRMSGDTLYLAFKTGDPKAIDNAAPNLRYLFKSGGALDLQIRPQAHQAREKRVLDIDRRLLIAKVQGRFVAMLFSPETPGTPDEQKVLYESPIGSVRFDRVVDVSAQVRVAQNGGDFEVALPASLLNLQLRRSTQLLGDIGLIRGNGTQNTQRSLWHNSNTQLVSDIPSEARLEPANWGLFEFVAETAAGSVALLPENAKRVGKTMQLKKLGVEEYAIGFWSNPADYLEWPDVAAPAGTYEVELNYACGSRGGNEVILSTGQQSLTTKTQGTGGWSAFTTVTLGKVVLGGGRATFTLKAKSAEGGLMDFKALTLIPVKP